MSADAFHALFAVLVIAVVVIILSRVFVDVYKHHKVSKRMEQYNKWTKLVPKMSPAEQQKAKVHLHACLFDPNFDYRGPWEKMKL